MKLVADLNMKEFDPTKERHLPLLIVKAVDPGCTLEPQIENAVTGEVVRLTTTSDAAKDDADRMVESRRLGGTAEAVAVVSRPADSASPGRARRERSSARARCRRPLTVPTGQQSWSAASSSVLPWR